MLFEGQKITCQVSGEGICELKFDAKDDSVNKFDQTTLRELNDALEAVKKDRSVKGVLCTSGKNIFIVGADITEFTGLFEKPEEELVGWVSRGNDVFKNLEDLEIPTASAINGIALGGGFELALSTDYRILSSQAEVGLPEVKLGIFPGFGGTVRLSRVIGADNAIEWIATGSNQKAEAALKAGAVDSVVEPDKLREAATQILKDAIENKFDWKAKRQEKLNPLKLDNIESMMVFETAKGFIAGKAGPHYPAPVKAVEAMQKGAGKSRDKALEIESKTFAKVAKTSVAANLIGLFLNDQFLKKKTKKYQKTAGEVKSAAVLGAGIMGGGVAYQSAYKGIPIYMKDIHQDALKLGYSEATGLLEKRVKRGRMTAAKMGEVLNSISGTLSYEDMKDVDIVVEAVVENVNVKKSVLGELETKVKDSTVITSNTSTISITELARDLKRPENFCGMHFFNPVHKMPLVEVIRGEKSSENAIATTVAYAAAMGKTPIVVNDCPGFLVNRILFPYFAGFMLMIRDGVDYERIDKVMEKFGWPMGPAYLQDVVGMDTAHHAGEVMAAAFPDRMKFEFKSALEAMFEKKRFGQKTEKGFYQYTLDKKGRQKKQSDPEAKEIIQAVMEGNKEVNDEEIIDRMMIPMVIESARCLEDKIVETPSEVDMGLIFGVGFPPFRGGAMKYIDSVGLAEFCEKAKKYSDLGKVYEPTETILKMVQDGKKYYEG